MAGQVVLMKMGMGRFPTVEAVVSASTLFEVCAYYYEKNDAIAYVVGAGLAGESLTQQMQFTLQTWMTARIFSRFCWYVVILRGQRLPS